MSHELVVIVESEVIQMSLVVLIKNNLHGTAVLGHEEVGISVIGIHSLSLNLREQTVFAVSHVRHVADIDTPLGTTSVW